MNRIRMVNSETGSVTYCDQRAVKDLQAIGFFEQPEPTLEVSEKKPELKNTKTKTDAANK